MLPGSELRGELIFSQFADGQSNVSCSSPFSDWIEQLAAEGVTAACGIGNYCPGSPTTRGQMAVFLTKAFQLP